MASLTLGIDIGSTSTKVVLADPATGVLAQASAPVELSSRHPGWAEADPAAWWRNVRALVPEVLAEVSAAEVAAVACTGMVPAVVAVDKSAAPLRPAILQNDARATTEIAELSAALPDVDFTAVTGSALTQQSVAPTLRWLARHEPSVWADTVFVLGSYDWLAAVLGAPPRVERNWALESGLYALSDGSLLSPVLAAGGIDPSVLPPVSLPGTVLGEVSAEAAAQTGLAAGTPIVTGGADHVLSAYAAGSPSPATGWSSWAALVTSWP